MVRRSGICERDVVGVYSGMADGDGRRFPVRLHRLLSSHPLLHSGRGRPPALTPFQHTSAIPQLGLHIELVNLANAVGLTEIVQRRFFSDKSGLAFSAAPGTDDFHG